MRPFIRIFLGEGQCLSEASEVLHTLPLALPWLHSWSLAIPVGYNRSYIPLGRDTVYPILVWQLHVRYSKEWRANNGVFLITLPDNVTWVYCCWEARFSLVGVACVYSVYCNIWQVHAIVTEVLQTHCILPCCTWRVFYGCGYHLIVLSCSQWHQWCMLQGMAISLSWRCL